MNKISVLVVDDEKPLRDFVRRNLDVRGYAILTANNGLEALAVFNTQLVNLVILDVMMPRMDGLETLRRIRQLSSVPVIVLSAMGEEDDKIQALNSVADDYLTKPFGVGELLARVQAVVRRASFSPAPQDQDRLSVAQSLQTYSATRSLLLANRSYSPQQSSICWYSG
jgi:DNA-binding response OmpR family regulator